MTRFLGIDWATDPNNRAAVELLVEPRGLVVSDVVTPYGDDAALAHLRSRAYETIGVDTPFGWPSRFVEFARTWSASGGGPPPPDSRAFSLRRTDLVVHEECGKVPLSVSSDRIALCARSWVDVLARAGEVARVDVGSVAKRRAIIEVYPAVTLRTLVQTESAKRYKKTRSARRQVLTQLIKACSLDVKEKQDALMGAGDADSHSFDALLAALAAAAYSRALKAWDVRRPKPEEAVHAKSEGWIFFLQGPSPRPAPRSAGRRLGNAKKRSIGPS